MVEPLQVKNVDLYLNAYAGRYQAVIADASSAAFHNGSKEGGKLLGLTHFYKQPHFRVELRDAQNEAQSCYEVAKYFLNRGQGC